MSRSTLKDFDVISRLGAGSFGTVYKAKRIIDEKLYVMKVVRIGELSHRERSDAINEVQILAQLKSPFVVCYYDSFIEKENLHIVMEFCNRGDLQNLLKKAKERNVSGLKEPIVWNMSLQIILGLYYLHKKNILHRDLKSANVFLNKDSTSANYHLKIGDLGVAKLMDTSTALARTIVGTPYYLSPELCKDMPYRDKSDCWALGVIIYECCTLEHPFEARNQCALIMKIIEAPVKPPPPSNASPVLTNLILWLLQKDPRLRPSIRDLLKEVEVRNRLRDEGLDLPEEVVGGETTNYLVDGLPTQLPKELEEKASAMDDDGTISLMTTLVDDKDAGHRSFRVAAAALSAQQQPQPHVPVPITANGQKSHEDVASVAAPPIQRAPSTRLTTVQTSSQSSVGTEQTTGSTPAVSSGAAVKRTGSMHGNIVRANSSTSTGSTTAAVTPTPSTTTATVVGNRVRGNNRARGNVPSDKARTRYQRPPIGPSTGSNNGAGTSHVQTAVTTSQQVEDAHGSTAAEYSETVDGLDNLEIYDRDDENHEYDEAGNQYQIDKDNSNLEDFDDAKPVTLTQSRRPSQRLSAKDVSDDVSEMPIAAQGLHIAEAKDSDIFAIPTPDAKKLRSDSKRALIDEQADDTRYHHDEDEDEKYENDFVPEEEEDRYDVDMATAAAAGGKVGIAHGFGAKADQKDTVSTAFATSMSSTGHVPIASSASASLYYNRSMMSTGMSAMQTMSNLGQGDDAELWNSIWTEKRGMVDAESHSRLKGVDSIDERDEQERDEQDSIANQTAAAAVPIQEVNEMLDMARKKAVADLGEGLFTKIYSLLSRYMKQDHRSSSSGSTSGTIQSDIEEEEEAGMNLRMLQELETLLGEELQVHGVALVSDAVFRVRALLAFESKCSVLLSPTGTDGHAASTSKPTKYDSGDTDHKETPQSSTYRSDLPTVQDSWQTANDMDIRRK